MNKKIKSKYSKIIFDILFCSIGCLSCYYLCLYFNSPNYVSSIIVGLLGSFIPQNNFFDHKKAIACIYTGSFASMCLLKYFSSSLSVYFLCIIVGIYFIILSPYFRGYGGKLGAIAFISSMTFVGLEWVL